MVAHVDTSQTPPTKKSTTSIPCVSTLYLTHTLSHLFNDNGHVDPLMPSFVQAERDSVARSLAHVRKCSAPVTSIGASKSLGSSEIESMKQRLTD